MSGVKWSCDLHLVGELVVNCCFLRLFLVKYVEMRLKLAEIVCTETVSCIHRHRVTLSAIVGLLVTYAGIYFACDDDRSFSIRF